MNRRQRAVLAQIYTEPTPADIRWSDIEALLRSLGAEITEGSGSRVRLALNGVRAVFHRPHPSQDTKRGAVRAMRDFLTQAGVVPPKDTDHA